MARPSKIDRMDPQLRETIAQLRQSGRTIDEILDHLKALGVADLSRSGLGRHVQELDQLGEQIRSSRAVAESLVQRFGDAPENRQARLNIELMHSLIMRLFAATPSAGDSESGKSAILDPKEVMFLASALKNLTGAAKDDADLVAKLRKEAEARALAAMKAKLGDLEKEGSVGKRRLDADTLRQVREIYGIVG